MTLVDAEGEVENRRQGTGGGGFCEQVGIWTAGAAQGPVRSAVKAGSPSMYELPASSAFPTRLEYVGYIAEKRKECGCLEL